MTEKLTTELRTKLVNNLQFAILLATFFSATLDALQKNVSAKEDTDLAIKWGIVIAVLVVEYLFLDALDQVFSNWVGLMIKWFLWLEIAMFGYVYYFLAEASYGSVIGVEVSLLKFCALGLAIDPVLMVIILAANSTFLTVLDIISNAK